MQKKTFNMGVAYDVLNTSLLLLLSLITLYPLLYVLFASFSDSNMLAGHGGLLHKPLGFTIASYRYVFRNSSIWIGYGNTILYVVFGTMLSLAMTTLGAYVTSCKDFFWTKYIMPYMVFTMFFSGGLIPTFLVVKGLGLYDNPLALLLPSCISTWNLIIMRTFFSGIPRSLKESTKIDGANEWIILTRIILPLSGSVIAVMILYYAVGLWNGWFNAMIYLRNRSLFPLQLFLREILISNSGDDMVLGINDAERQTISESIKYATIIVSTLPILTIYPLLQKHFVKGVMIGAVKG